MTKKLILFLTSSFPFPPGEQFIESEISHWSSLPWGKVVVVPGSSSGSARPVPDDINVSFSNRRQLRIWKVFYIVRAVGAPLLWRELCWLISKRLLSIKTVKAAVKATATTLLSAADLQRQLKRYGRADVAYSYWNTTAAYAACILKRKGHIKSVVSRAHRFDLYEEQHPARYIPLKRQFCNDFNAIYAISNEAKEYLARTFGFRESALQVSRLGVRLPAVKGGGSADGVVRICSASFCVPVKQVDKIIDAIRRLGEEYPERNFEWRHMGDGPLRAQLEDYAQKKLGALKNIRYQFAGMQSNQAILAYYETQPVDIFINTSSSEGVPVSIMEAMSFGIPAIAPAVGGIAELVNDQTGVLLNPDFETADVASAVLRLTGVGRDVYRRAARERIENSYCADTNYKAFVSKIKDQANCCEKSYPNRDGQKFD